MVELELAEPELVGQLEQAVQPKLAVVLPSVATDFARSLAWHQQNLERLAC